MLGKDSQLKGSTITPLLGIAITFIKLADMLVYALPIFLKRTKCTMVVGAEDNSKCRHLPLDPVHILISIGCNMHGIDIKVVPGTDVAVDQNIGNRIIRSDDRNKHSSNLSIIVKILVMDSTHLTDMDIGAFPP